MQDKKIESGFTLVEIAIVLIIIGLLIAGILKGIELVENSKTTQFIRAAKAYSTATMAFQNTFRALPGDMRQPDKRLPGCTTSPCTVSGDENGKIGAVLINLISYPDTDTDETRTYWLHLAHAGLIDGIDVNALFTTAQSRWGTIFPTTPFGQGFMVHEYRVTTSPNDLSGLYLSWEGIGGLTANRAFRIDEKMDDGQPFKGQVMVADDAACVNMSLTPPSYDLHGTSETCLVKIKL